jgi:hypothetical protein
MRRGSAARRILTRKIALGAATSYPADAEFATDSRRNICVARRAPKHPAGIQA